MNYDLMIVQCRVIELYLCVLSTKAVFTPPKLDMFKKCTAIKNRFVHNLFVCL